MDINTLNSEQLQTYEKQETPQKHIKGQPATQEELAKTLEESAVSVSISMNAQIVLFGLETTQQSKGNFLSQSALGEEQNDILNFLSGQEASNGLSLKDIGYEGKPILELSQDEAQELISDDGFFGITQTSDRVANFVFSFAGDNLELLEEGKKGIIQGFEEAEKLFGGELPEISYQTQERTLELINQKIKEVQEGENN